jgi:hypothetical protein
MTLRRGAQSDIDISKTVCFHSVSICRVISVNSIVLFQFIAHNITVVTAGSHWHECYKFVDKTSSVGKQCYVMEFC